VTSSWFFISQLYLTCFDSSRAVWQTHAGILCKRTAFVLAAFTCNID